MKQAAFAPKISVIVPVYNCEAYVGRCLESILAQDYRDIEVIVVDDGSTDASTGICRAYAARDERVLLLRQDNRGQGAARNAGLELATGDYVAFVDSDDYIAPGTLRQYVTCLSASPKDIAISGYRTIRNGKIVEEYRPQHCMPGKEDALEELYEDATFRNFLCNKVYRRTLFDGIRFPEGKVYEDVAVQYRLFEKAAAFLICPFCGYSYVQRRESTTNQITLSHCFDYIEVLLCRFEAASVRTPRLLRQLARGIVKPYMALIVCGLLNFRQRGIFLTRRHAVDEHLRSLIPTIKPYLGSIYFIVALGACGTACTDLLIGLYWAGNKVCSKVIRLCRSYKSMPLFTAAAANTKEYVPHE